MNIMFMSTGNLLPGSAAWSSLASHRLQFAELNMWSQILMAPDGLDKQLDLIVWVVNLEDLIPRSLSSQAGNVDEDTSLESEIRLQLEPLRAFCDGHGKTRIIVAWSHGATYSPIQYARCIPWFEKVNSAWERQLRDLQADCEGLFLLPLYPQFALTGLTKCYDTRNYYAGYCRFSFQGIKIIAQSVSDIIYRFEEAPKKVLVLDCDNTLWGGVVGEDGIEGLTLGNDGEGKAFQDFQKGVLALAKQGILVGICSKNNEEDVWEVFEKHPEMRLTRNDIVAYRINWHEKADNLREIADDLDLALNSFVFWDDNRLEREKIRTLLPDVIVPEVPKEVCDWETALLDMVEFHKFTITEEDRKKVTQYHSRAKFINERKSSDSLTEFMHSLELKPSILFITPPLLSRSEQLCVKTNQFNLSLRRYDSAAILALSKDPDCLVFLVHMQDRFGDHGNVGMVIVRQIAENKLAVLDTFLLSCRILGRHLEAWILEQIRKYLFQKDIKHLVAEYIPAARNQMILGFLKMYGFEEIDINTVLNGKSMLEFKTTPDSILFQLDLEEVNIPNLEHFSDEN
jgi:FkbH-like protein